MRAPRDLTNNDLRLAPGTLCASERPPANYAALEAVSGEVIGHRLFTIMRFDAARSEVERVHSSLQSVYPIGGRKKKADVSP